MAGIDLSQFHEVFFEESGEGVDTMESGLLSLDPNQPNEETINNVFRAAHSIKGGAATFGFQEVADFTHVLETLLDNVRGGEVSIEDELIQLLLESVDFLKHLLGEAKAERPVAEADIEVQVARLAGFEAGSAAVAEAVSTTPATTGENTPTNDTAPGVDSTGKTHWKITFVPEPELFKTGNDPYRIIRELTEFGEVRTLLDESALPLLSDMDPESCYLSWEIRLTNSTATEADIMEVFDWVLDEARITLTETDASGNAIVAAEISAEAEDIGEAESAPSEEISAEVDVDVSDAESIRPAGDEPIAAAPEVAVDIEAPGAPEPAADTAQAETNAADDKAERAEKPAEPAKPVRTAAERVHHVPEVTSIRVNIERVDMLVNLVGELVITQSMLSRFKEHEDAQLFADLIRGIEQLEENTRELQEHTMRIRMLPIDNVFQRMPRLIRDLSKTLGKEVELVMQGNTTEVDKTVLEKISDPLTHLVRNSLDHGIEGPDERTANGKSSPGTVQISAYHEGGSIVIEVQDDGRGLNRRVIFDKAVEKGIIEADAEMTDQEIDLLIFAPGFSTAEQISDVSGRGVGMDVVKNNIEQLGGHIEVRSQAGEGSCFTIKLPLTLAIIEGQLVRVGTDVFIIPLLSIVKSTRIDADKHNVVGGNANMFHLEDDYIPIVPLKDVYHIESDNDDITKGILVIVDSVERFGIVVDEVLGQQQVVVKSLETNFKEVPTISGATILGDGTVAMILDMAGLLRETRQMQAA